MYHTTKNDTDVIQNNLRRIIIFEEELTMKKAAQWIFGMLFAVALLLSMQHCYAYEGESEEEWVNRMWYNTQWTVARAAPKDADLIGRSLTFARGFGDYIGYSDVMPWMESGRIQFMIGEALCSVEIMAGGSAIMYDENGKAMFGFMNMAAGNTPRNRR